MAFGHDPRDLIAVIKLAHSKLPAETPIGQANALVE
jgi:hypothetical protein